MLGPASLSPSRSLSAVSPRRTTQSTEASVKKSVRALKKKAVRELSTKQKVGDLNIHGNVAGTRLAMPDFKTGYKLEANK